MVQTRMVVFKLGDSLGKRNLGVTSIQMVFKVMGIDEVTWEKHRTMRANGPFLSPKALQPLDQKRK